MRGVRETRYIRFDWAMKRLLRHKADFVVIEGFLSSLLGEPVKIAEVLESEGNRESADSKTNRADVLVRDAQGRKILIEIQNYFQRDFFQRMLYGASKLVTEHLGIGESYGGIGKVYSVNIVYFTLGEGEDYVYRGRTDFKGIHRGDTLRLDAGQRKVFGGEMAGDVFPEYFILRVEDFDKKAKTPLDQWIHFLKTEEIPARFAAPGLAEARERLDEARLSPAERAALDRHYHYLRIENSEYESADAKGEARGIVIGEARGIAIGETNAKLAMARALAADGMSHDKIATYTGLSCTEVIAVLKDADAGTRADS